MKTVSIDNKGITLIELTISILISSILISMLLSLLT
ncbi:MAG: prepilin-type N-terminal cleavage/methylation domain-containing protein, partial [Bacilli bacterium]|nr:prepilin-type N-terminal cleavage/methylation domain-containing protein [Bacilli bacterium]